MTVYLKGIPYRALTPCCFECLVVPIMLGRDPQGWFLASPGRFEYAITNRDEGAELVAEGIRRAWQCR